MKNDDRNNWHICFYNWINRVDSVFVVDRQIMAQNEKYTKQGGLTKTVPPKRGPNPQGLKNGGCPFRENGVKSPIKGISNIQVKGQKFIGVK